MPMKWPAKLVLVIGVLVGIYYGASGEDRERWMAALRLSTTSAAKLRTENERQKYLAEKAAEQARWRWTAQTENDTVLAANSTLGGQETRAVRRSREA